MILEDFLKQYKTELIQVYINERQRQGNIYGILNINLTNSEKADVSFIPLNSDILTNELKIDIENKRQCKPNNTIFIFGTELDNNKNVTKLVEIEL